MPEKVAPKGGMGGYCVVGDFRRYLSGLLEHFWGDAGDAEMSGLDLRPKRCYKAAYFLLQATPATCFFLFWQLHIAVVAASFLLPENNCASKFLIQFVEFVGEGEREIGFFFFKICKRFRKECGRIFHSLHDFFR